MTLVELEAAMRAALMRDCYTCHDRPADTPPCATCRHAAEVCAEVAFRAAVKPPCGREGRED